MTALRAWFGGAAPRVPSPAVCADCRHFHNLPQHLEQRIPGLRVMGSGYSAVRAQDGLCDRHDRYLSAQGGCDAFAAAPAAATP